MSKTPHWVGAAVSVFTLVCGDTGQAKDVVDPALLSQRIEGFVAQEIQDDHLLGAVVLVAQDGKTLLLHSDGTTDVARAHPMQNDSLFRIASMTKPIVSVAVMMAVETGKIGLDDPISHYLPELADVKVRASDGALVQPTNAPLIYDLLRHTGGFTYSFAGAAAPDIRQAYRDADIEQSRRDMSSDAMLAQLADIPLAFQPGTQFEYSVGVDLLGFILERVYGESLDTILDAQIFTPLGMTQTRFKVATDISDRLAEAPQSDPMKPFTEHWMRVAAKSDGGYLSGGGGLVSTAEDYARFAQMLLNKGQYGHTRLLSPATVDLMTSDHIAGLQGSPAPFTGPGYGFGLGLAMRLDVGGAFVQGAAGDLNWSGLNGTTFTIDPENNLIAIFMAAAPHQRNHLRFTFRNILYGAMKSPDEKTN